MNSYCGITEWSMVIKYDVNNKNIYDHLLYFFIIYIVYIFIIYILLYIYILLLYIYIVTFTVNNIYSNLSYYKIYMYL